MAGTPVPALRSRCHEQMLTIFEDKSSYIQCLPNTGTRVQDPRCRVPAASRQALLTIRRPGSLIYNSALSSKMLNDLSCRLRQTPAPDSRHSQIVQASLTPSSASARMIAEHLLRWLEDKWRVR